MLRVGLTGGIGSGKSAVAARLEHHGAAVVDADAIAREVVAPGTAGLAAVAAAFGDGVQAEDGSLDRPALAAIVFADPAARATLNAIVHPLIGAETGRRVAEAQQRGAHVLIHDIPLLVEGGLAPGYHLVLVVEAPVEQRLARVLARSGLDEAQVRARMAAQAQEADRRAVADVWVDNGGSLAELHARLDALWSERLQPYAENLAVGRRAPRAPHALIADPDPTWEAQAGRSLARVRRVVAARGTAEHIGSTAVPGLPAKDVLDLMVVVANLAVAEEVAADLQEAGLVRPPGRWWDALADGTEVLKAFTANADPGRAVNCHVRTVDAPNVAEALLLRDWLRAHPERAAAYATTKRRLAALPHATIDDYADSKSDFIRGELAAARLWSDRRAQPDCDVPSVNDLAP